MAKVLVSFDDDLLRRIDARAKELGLSRSAYLARMAHSELDPDRARRGAEFRRARDLVRKLAPPQTEHVDVTTALREERDERLRKLGGSR